MPVVACYNELYKRFNIEQLWLDKARTDYSRPIIHSLLYFTSYIPQRTVRTLQDPLEWTGLENNGSDCEENCVYLQSGRETINIETTRRMSHLILVSLRFSLAEYKHVGFMEKWCFCAIDNKFHEDKIRTENEKKTFYGLHGSFGWTCGMAKASPLQKTGQREPKYIDDLLKISERKEN